MLNEVIKRMCIEVPDRDNELKAAAQACRDHRLASSSYCVIALPDGEVKDLHKRAVAGDMPSRAEWAKAGGAAEGAEWVAAWCRDCSVWWVAAHLVIAGSTWDIQINNLIEALNKNKT